MFLLLFIQLILFFIFLIKRLKPIRNFMYIFKPIKSSINSLFRNEIISKANNNKKEINKYWLIQDFINKSKIKSEKKRKPNNNERKKIFNFKTILKDKKNDETFFKNKKIKIKSFKKRKKYKFTKKLFNNLRKSPKYKNKKKFTFEENGINLNKDNKNKNNKINFSILNKDFQDMDYSEALNLDKRSWMKIYWSYLVDSQIILGTFFTSNFLHLFVIKLSFLISIFQINFFLNALFYTDEYISDAYHNDGTLDFFSGLPKSIYSFLASLVFTGLLGLLSNSKNELVNTIKNRTIEIDYIL